MVKQILKGIGEIVIFRTKDGESEIQVHLEKDTVWLTQKQMAALFKTERSVITKHIHNIIRDKELFEDSVSALFAQTAVDGKTYKTAFYNLDMIISVGYRVNSKRGTQFRIWATNILRDHLVKGYSLNQRRLQESKQRLKELEAAVELVEKTKSTKTSSIPETAGLLTVITEYTRSWLLLHQYDEGTLATRKLHCKVAFRLNEAEAEKDIDEFRKKLVHRKEASDLFGREKERGILKGILRGIDQTFGGVELYPSIEDKAANLLYFVIKDHPFIDGNKRVASLLFIWFLLKNNLLSHRSGIRKVNDNALVALTLLIAESDPKQKDMMVKLIVSMISGE